MTRWRGGKRGIYECAGTPGDGLTVGLGSLGRRGSFTIRVGDGETRGPEGIFGARRGKLVEVDGRVGCNLRNIYISESGVV